jgi:hypothetical protein
MKIFEILISPFLIAIFGFLSMLYAADYHVSTSFQLSEKLLVSEDSGEDDTIYLAPGVYKGNFSCSATGDKSLTLKPEHGYKTGDVILDGNKQGRVFSFYSAYASNLQLEGITFQNGYYYYTGYENTYGGGIYCSTNGKFILLNSIIANNEVSASTSSGGGIYIKANITISLINNIIINNKASDNSSYGNSSDDAKGGGIYIDIANKSVILNVCNNIIRNNSAPNGTGDNIYLTGSASIERFYHNNSQYYGSDFHSKVGNINSPPQFIDEENGNYRLKPTSPCIDAGTNEINNLPVHDKDGNDRPVNNITDIGAYEYSPQVIHPADWNKDWTIDQNEFKNYDNAWKNGAQWPGGPNPIPVSYVTRAGYIYIKGGEYHNAGGDKPGCWVLKND